jgi:succinoglycan biosynthesis transport protein ExoP
VRVLAEIPARSAGLRPGTLRRGDVEAYGGLLEQLGGARAVLLAGDAPGRREGALCLAAAAAATGTRTALLECELARPALADALGLAGAPGLREYLRGEAEAERILKPVALAGPGSAAARDALVCVVAGRSGDDAATLLGSERFRHVLRSLRDAYELLVVDWPSTATGTEPLIAAAAEADAVVAWVERAAPEPQLPVAATGLVVQI